MSAEDLAGRTYVYEKEDAVLTLTEEDGAGSGRVNRFTAARGELTFRGRSRTTSSMSRWGTGRNSRPGGDCAPAGGRGPAPGPLPLRSLV